MNVNSFVHLILTLILIATLYSRHLLQAQLTETHTELLRQTAKVKALYEKVAAQETELTGLKGQLKSDQSRIDGLNAQAARETSDLQVLENALAQQRQRAETKRKEYQALLGNGAAPTDDAAQRKLISDDTHLLQQQLSSVKDDIARTNDSAAQAKQAHRLDSDLAINQAKGKVDSAQQALNALKTQKSTVQHTRGNPYQQSELRNLDEQIAAAQANLNALKIEQANLNSGQKAGGQQLNSQIQETLRELKNEQQALEKKLQAKQNELVKVDSHSAAAGSFQKERAALLNKLAAELKDETEKLKALETRVREQKARH